MSDTLAYAPAELDFRVAGNDVVVHDPLHDRVHVLNRMAAYILQLCNGQRSAQVIADDVSTRTGVPSVQALPDVRRALTEFRALHLVR